MPTPVFRGLLGLLLAAALPTLAHAEVGENLVVNPDFDEDLDGWSNVVEKPDVSVIRSPVDSQGSDVSGSAQLSITLPPLVFSSWDISSACVPIGEIETFAFGADYLIPPVLFASRVFVCLEWFEDEDCTTPILVDEIPVDPDCVDSVLQGSWMLADGIVDASPGAQGVRLNLVNFNPNSGDDGGEFVVLFDHVFLPEPSRWAQAFVVIALGGFRAQIKGAGRSACAPQRQASPR
ncbi:MAG: hypothetical protein ABFS46_08150 [Myxococcota bacterium]